MQVFLIILGIVWVILCLVLFFKIWGACNNIDEIKKHICNNPTNTNGISNLGTSPTTKDNPIEETTEEPDGFFSAKTVLGIAILFILILIILIITTLAF